MGEIIRINEKEDTTLISKADKNQEFDEITELTEEMLQAVQNEILQSRTFSMPIVESALLGIVVSLLFLMFKTITQTITFNTQGLYQFLLMEFLL